MNDIPCRICPNHCYLGENEVGKCFAWKMRKGQILQEPLRITSINLDTVEKKPIFHFKPNSKILSIGGCGCSLRCSICQNYKISASIPQRSIAFTDEKLVKMAKEYEAAGVFFSYSEPNIYYERLSSLSNAAHEGGLFFGIKTNAYLTSQYWRGICHNCDVMNIDLKGTIADYRNRCDCLGHNYILNNIAYALKIVKNVEVSIPVYPDIESYSAWIDDVLASIDLKNVPIHLLKVFPANEYDGVATEEDALFDLRDYLIASGYNYVYISNIFSRKGIARNTYDPVTKKIVTRREKYISYSF